MSLPQKILSIWRSDTLLRRVVKNSSYLFGSNTVAAVLTFMQGIFIVRLLGIAGLGLVTAIITFASNVNRLLSFRMSEVVVKRFSQALAEDNKAEAAAAIKVAGLIEAVTSVFAYLVLLVLASWAAVIFGKDAQSASWFAFYGLILLSNLVYETSTGVLQATHRFDRVARINLNQAVITAAIISAVFLLNLFFGKAIAPYLIWDVLAAYVFGKTYACIAILILALRELHKTLGAGWWREPLSTLKNRREMFTFALNTNLNGTVNLFVRDNIPLYMAALLSKTEVGYMRLAQTLITPILLILDPFIWPTYAEITRTVAQKQWDATRRLLKRVSAVAGSVVLALGGGLVLVGWWLIPILYTPAARPAYPVLVILLIGYGFANVFQWNRPLFLALGKPGYPVWVAALTGLVELTLIFLLVPHYGYLMMAAILSGYFIISIGLTVWRGFAEIRRLSDQQTSRLEN